METVVTNVAGKAHYDTLYGRKYLVVNGVFIVPGVLNGSLGPLLYLPEDIARSQQDWNHMPMVVYHPTRAGQAISARSREVLNQQGIGLILNSKADPRLAGELWFDEEATSRLDSLLLSRKLIAENQQIVPRLLRGEPIELSTGLFTDNEPAPQGAVYNGKNPDGTASAKPYSFIARNYRPDHLAILPNLLGACSVKDGCGVAVNSAPAVIPLIPFDLGLNRDQVLQGYATTLLVNGELSYREKLDRIWTTFRQSHPSEYDSQTGRLLKSSRLKEVYESYVVYCQVEGGYDDSGKDQDYKEGYSWDGSTVTFDGEPEAVERVVTYEPVTGNQLEDGSMASKTLTEGQKKELVKGLLASNCSCPEDAPWKGKDEATLNAMADGELIILDSSRKWYEKQPAQNSGQQQGSGGQQAVQAPPIDGFTDALGNRHVFNSNTRRWETTLAPATNGQQAQQGNGQQGGVAVPPTAAASAAVSGSRPKPMSELLAMATEEDRAAWNHVLAVNQQQKQALLDQILVNYDEAARPALLDVYKDMPIDRLQLIANTMPRFQVPQQQSGGNGQQAGGFGGFYIPGGPPRAMATNEEPLLSPAYNFGGK